MAIPPQPTPPPPDSIMLQRFVGIRNTVSAERLTPEEFESAVNVDLDDVGQLHRRRGRRQVMSGEIHSLFTANDDTVYGVKGGTLGIIRPDYSFAPLRVGLGKEPLAYLQLGPDIYFSSMVDSGIIHADGTVSNWGAFISPGYWLSPVVNPTATLPAVRGKLYGAPPMATCLAYYNGRIYLANEKTLWYTELYLYNYVDKTKGFLPFESNITCLGSVADGIYIGTETDVWFLSFQFNFIDRRYDMKRVRVIDYGAIRGSMVSVPADEINPQVPLNQDAPLMPAVAFLTQRGVVCGLPGGQCFNLTEDRLWFPDAISAAALYRKQDGMHQYIATMNSDGQPSNNARIGDYVDAQLIRGGAWVNPSSSVRIGDSATAVIV